jgi:hypothetical protein
MKDAKEKANELVDKMYFSRRYKDEENYIPKQAFIHAKQCALIAVDEILSIGCVEVPYWYEVKQEIEKL